MNKASIAIMALSVVACTVPESREPRAPAQHMVQVDDKTVTLRVQAALARDPALAPHAIEVSTQNGRVTLSGEVRTMIQRKKADSVVRGVPGVRGIENLLIITG